MIGVDWDEVVAPLLGPHCKFLNKKYGLNLCENNFTTYEWWKHYNVTKKQALDDLDEFCNTNKFDKITPYVGAIQGIPELRRLDEIAIISDRPRDLRDSMEKIINKYFFDKISHIHLGEALRAKENYISKREKCQQLGVILMLEDTVHNAIEISNDIPVILFTRKWNQNFDEKLFRNIHRVKNWQQGLKKVKELYKSKI